MTVTEITCPRCGESLLTAIHVVDGCVVGSVYEQVVGVIGDVSGLTAEECDEIARALDQAGLLAHAPSPHAPTERQEGPTDGVDEA